MDEKIDHRELKVDPRKFGHEKRLKSAVCGQNIRRKVNAPVGKGTRIY